MTNAAMLQELIEKLRSAKGPSRELDFAVCEACGSTNPDESAPPVTFSLEAAISLARDTLPGWSWRVAQCHVSDDAWIIPDFLNPVNGERLRDTLSQDIDWTDLTDVDRRPSGFEALALCISILLGLQAMRDERYSASESNPLPSSPAGTNPADRREDEVVAVPRSTLTELYLFFHETWKGTGGVSGPGSFGEELLKWRERISNIHRQPGIGAE